MLRNTNRVVQTGESWWSLAILVHQAWTKGVPVLVATGAFAWVASRMQILADQGWPAFVFMGLLGAFTVLGAASFVANLRFKWSASRALAQGIAWSQADYSPYSVIDGGTHSVAAIFGQDHVRSRVVFRNCTIEGPGVVALFDSSIEKCDIAGSPVPVVLHMSDDFAQISNFVPTAHKCQFINCTFYNIILVDQPKNGQSHPTHIFASIARLEQQKAIEDKSTEPDGETLNDKPQGSPEEG